MLIPLLPAGREGRIGQVTLVAGLAVLGAACVFKAVAASRGALRQEAERFVPVARVRAPSPSSCLRGTVTFADGRPVPGAMVRCARIRGDNARNLVYAGFRTNAQGRFDGPPFPGNTPKARYLLSVAPGLSDPRTGQPCLAAPQTVTALRGRSASVRFVLLPPAFVRGRVCTRSGRPVAGAWVQVPDIALSRGYSSSHSLSRTVSDREGRFFLPVPVGPITLEVARTRATHHTGTPQNIALAPGAVGDVTLRVALTPLEPRTAAGYTGAR